MWKAALKFRLFSIIVITFTLFILVCNCENDSNNKSTVRNITIENDTLEVSPLITSFSASNFKENVYFKPLNGETTCILQMLRTYICPDKEAFTRQLTVFQRGMSRSRWLPRQLHVLSVNGCLHLPAALSTRLAVLDLTASGVTNLTAETPLLHLETLLLADNPDLSISTLMGLGTLSNLHTLDLSGSNGLSSYILSQLALNLPKLRNLDLSRCGLHTLAWCSTCYSSALQTVAMSLNQIQNFPLTGKLLNRLETLNVSHNKLTELRVLGLTGGSGDWGVDEKKHLQLLDLSHNLLTYVTPAVIYSLCDTGIVDVTDNPLNANTCSQQPLHQLYVRAPQRVVGGRDVLDFFTMDNITHCSWDMCPEKCLCLENERRVICMNVGLTSVPTFGPSDARELDLSYNRITTLEGLSSGIWINLLHLNVQNNHLISLTVSSSYLPSLLSLQAASNDISGISLSDCSLLTSLRTLNLTKNRLVTLDASPCGYLNVVILDGSRNFIKELSPLHMASLPYLRYLNLSQNTIRNLHRDAIFKMPVLKVLDLSRNHLKEIEVPNAPWSPFAFQHHRTLREVFVDNNDLEDLGTAVKLFVKKGVKVNLDNNPWRCTCEIGKNMKNLTHVWTHETRCNRTGDLVATFLKQPDNSCFLPHGVDKGKEMWLFLLVLLMVVIALLVLLCIMMDMPKRCHCFKREENQPQESFMYDLFLLYHDTDANVVRNTLVHQLLRYRPAASLLLCDELNLFGKRFPGPFGSYMKECHKVLVIVSSSSYNDDWTRRQVKLCFERYWNNSNFEIMGLLLQNCPTLETLRSDPDYEYLVEEGRRRRYVHLSDGDCMQQITRFMGSSRTDHRNSANITASTLNSILPECCKRSSHEIDVPPPPGEDVGIQYLRGGHGGRTFHVSATTSASFRTDYQPSFCFPFERQNGFGLPIVISADTNQSFAERSPSLSLITLNSSLSVVEVSADNNSDVGNVF